MEEQFGEREFQGFEREDWQTAEVIGDLLRALRRKKGFGLFFVQCNPAQGQRVIAAIRERFPQKRLVEIELNRQSETLYGELLERYQEEGLEVACVTGVEQALYGYEDTKRLAGWSSQEIYNYSWKGVPPLLSHLNRQRESFEANLPIALVFLVPSFVIDYFVQRAPDFFDWRSGFFKFAESSEDIKKASQELVDKDYQEYLALTTEQRMERIFAIKDKIHQLDSSDWEHKSNLLIEQARLFKSDGNSSQALDCFERALRVNPNNYKAEGRKSKLLYDLQRYAEAIESCERALEIKPDYVYGWNGKGIVLENLQRYEEAIASFERAVEIQPDYHYAWSNRGDALRNLERYEEAIESYERALEIKPNYVSAWNGKGIALENLKQYEEALASYERTLEIKPDNVYGWNGKGIALENLKQYEEALASYERAVEIQPDYHYAWDNRGNVLRDLERNEQALESYERALEIKPDYHYAWENKGYALYLLGRHQEASDCFARVAEIQPSDKYAWNNQGYLALAQDSYGLQPIFEKPLLIRQLQDCRGFQNMNKVDLERCHKSIKVLETALNLDPKFTLAWANLSFPTYYLQQYQIALQSCDRSLEINPENEYEINEIVYTNRGCILLQLHNPTAALQDFTTALEIDPQLDEAWIGQGTALYHLGRYSEALHSFTQALTFNHPLAQTNLTLIQQHLPG